MDGFPVRQGPAKAGALSVRSRHVAAWDIEAIDAEANPEPSDNSHLQKLEIY